MTPPPIILPLGLAAASLGLSPADRAREKGDLGGQPVSQSARKGDLLHPRVDPSASCAIWAT